MTAASRPWIESEASLVIGLPAEPVRQALEASEGRLYLRLPRATLQAALALEPPEVRGHAAGTRDDDADWHVDLELDDADFDVAGSIRF